MPTITQLEERRANVWSQMTEIMDAADTEGRDLSAEEAQKYDAAEADLEKLSGDIDRAKRHAGRDTVDRVDPIVNPGNDEQRQDDGDVDYRAIFESYVRRGMIELSAEQRTQLRENWADKETRAQSVGTASAGGYLVPEDYQAEIIRTMKDFGAVMDVARVLTTNTGAALPWPTVDDTSQVGALLAENTQVSEQDVALGVKQLDAYKYTSKLVRVSWELMQDSAFDMEAFLRDILGERVGRILNQHFTTGTGTAQPTGIVTGATSGKTAASTTAVTADELIDLQHSVDRAYRNSPRARFMLSDSALAAVRKLKDSNGQYLWAPGIGTDAPGTLLGSTYEVNTDMAVPAAGVKSVLYGDFYAGYVVRLVRGFEMIRLDERYADYAQVGFVGFARADGEVVNTSAYKALTQAAA